MDYKQNFFDNLDSDWSDLISDVYEEYKKPLFSFELANSLNLLWKPTLIKEDKKLHFSSFKKNINLFTDNDIKLFNFTSIKLINRDYKMEVYEFPTGTDTFVIYINLSDIIIGDRIYNKPDRLYTDIIKEYLGVENVNFLNNCGGFKIAYDDVYEPMTKTFNNLDEFFKNIEWADIIVKNNNLFNIIIHYMGDYDNNYLKQTKHDNIVIKELYKKSTRLN